MILDNLTNLKNMLLKTWKLILLALIVTILLRWKFGPEFFDLFGLILFLGLIYLGLFELTSKKPIPDWAAFSLIVVGLLGIIVDGATSFTLIKNWIFSIF